jgi:uncharacterized membrane protein
LVHYPLTFFLTASLLDITAFLSNRNLVDTATFAKIVTPENVPVLNTLSYFCTVAGLLTSIPTLITGVAEGYNVLFGGSIPSEDVKPGKLHPIAKMTIAHAWLNYASVAGAIYNWLTRRNVAGHSASGSNAIISALIMGALGYSAFLGGTLVYTRGMGVQRMGEGLEFKQKNEREAKGKNDKGEKKL